MSSDPTGQSSDEAELNGQRPQFRGDHALINMIASFIQMGNTAPDADALSCCLTALTGVWFRREDDGQELDRDPDGCSARISHNDPQIPRPPPVPTLNNAASMPSLPARGISTGSRVQHTSRCGHHPTPTPNRPTVNVYSSASDDGENPLGATTDSPSSSLFFTNWVSHGRPIDIYANQHPDQCPDEWFTSMFSGHKDKPLMAWASEANGSKGKQKHACLISFSKSARGFKKCCTLLVVTKLKKYISEFLRKR